MITRINLILDRVTADEQLKNDTIKFLENKLINQNTYRKIYFSARKMIFAACSIALVLTASVIGHSVYKATVAYICLDINPSVEIGINAFDRVVSTEGCNLDGKAVLKDCRLENLTIKNAVSKLILSVSKKGFIADDGSTVISITAETNNSTIAEKLETQAELGVNQAIKSENNVATISKDSVNFSIRTEAKKHSVSPGKFKLIKNLQLLDSAITIAQYKDKKVSQIVNKINELSKIYSLKKSRNSQDKQNTDNKSETKTNLDNNTNYQNNSKNNSYNQKNSNNNSNNQKNSNNSDKSNKNNTTIINDSTIASPTTTPKPKNKAAPNGKNKKNDINIDDVTPTPIQTQIQTPTPITKGNKGKGSDSKKKDSTISNDPVIDPLSSTPIPIKVYNGKKKPKD